jgi:hypothetical protein
MTNMFVKNKFGANMFAPNLLLGRRGRDAAGQS